MCPIPWVSRCSSCWDYIHFRQNGKTSPTPPGEGGAPFGVHGSTAHSQTCSLIWLPSTRALVWGGINATLLNVSSEWHSPGKEGGMLCHGRGCKLPGHQKTTKPLQLSSCRNVLPGRRRKKGREDRRTQMGTGSLKTCLNKHVALSCSLCFKMKI